MIISSSPRGGTRLPRVCEAVRRSVPYGEEPGYSEASRLWLYGNAKLLHRELDCIEAAFGDPGKTSAELEGIEREAERLVLEGKVLVCGIHNPAHQRAAIVPLRWGSPRIVVFSGGFWKHLGPDLNDEPFRAARLWRYAWDPETDLAVSRRAPEKLPTYSLLNATVDRLIESIASRQWPGLRSPADLLTPLLLKA